MKTKITLSIDKETYEQFKQIKRLKGYSISAWVTSLMAQEVESYKRNLLCELESGISIAKAMYEIGMRLTIIKEKLLPIYGPDQTEVIMQEITK